MFLKRIDTLFSMKPLRVMDMEAGHVSQLIQCQESSRGVAEKPEWRIQHM